MPLTPLPQSEIVQTVNLNPRRLILAGIVALAGASFAAGPAISPPAFVAASPVAASIPAPLAPTATPTAAPAPVAASTKLPGTPRVANPAPRATASLEPVTNCQAVTPGRVWCAIPFYPEATPPIIPLPTPTPPIASSARTNTP